MEYAQSGGSYTYRSGFVYDTLNNLTRWEQVINGTTYTTDYTYDEDNRITGVTEGPVSKVYTYDGYGRASQQQTAFNGTTVKTDSYTFQPSESGTTFQVQSHTVTLGSTTTDTRYTYDLNGNITAIIRDDGTVTYTYDSANQLIREEKAGAYRHSWTYDNAGNILSRTEEAWTGSGWGPATVYTYTYGDSAWGDKLTAYNGQAITYDEIGNPLTDGTRTYTWQHGRQLASMTVGNTTWRFAYDAEGLRTQRTDGTTTWQYLYSGGQLVQMTRGNDTIHFTYDLGGRPLALTLNGTVYYYVTNLQGDVLAIADETGNVVVRYSYDAWGNLLSVTGTGATGLGTLNPLTYRGYVYDHETGLYYLQSRYYNPETGRFLNADGLLATDEEHLNNSLFTFCLNNPVVYIDPSGYDAIVLFKQEFPGHIGIMIQDPEDENVWWHFYWGVEATGYVVLAALGFPVPVTTRCEKFVGDPTLSNINNTDLYDSDYDIAVRLAGDFSKALETINNLGNYYHLYTLNCVRASLFALMSANDDYDFALAIAASYTLPKQAIVALIAALKVSGNENFSIETKDDSSKSALK